MDGPVVILVSYCVEPAQETGFFDAMVALGRSRQRTGASQWQLFRSGEKAGTFVEAFVVRSWDEHPRQHHTRLTGHDLLVEQNVRRFTTSEPTSQHLVAVKRN
ncbi:hypothetical protein AFA91_08620 [Mycolicibacterium goodii]|uniref:Antibiotic biosynthesis monooxygenase n=1 Tax=Mycolicibacterium goodii TaxID=134601 RepID=A0A0K0X3J9_MYCGD|nr:hypothetical protein AFA91_08620 [Mycolicibacterium goodii]